MKRLLSPVPAAVLLCVAALLGLLGYGLASTGTDRGIEETLRAGERPAAPDIELARLGSEDEARLSDWRGQVVVLNYWASWCTPCRDESPLLQTWHERMQEQGGTVLGIDVRDTTDDAQEFIEEFGLTYPHLKDGPGETQDDYGVAGIPETFVIDRRGRIAAVRRGPVDAAFLEAEVPPLLEER
jgi:cytochrome c biogenesis protein CcmG, thiol:disulfide interchange protein DsbE